jgi:hypothetical protein
MLDTVTNPFGLRNAFAIARNLAKAGAGLAPGASLLSGPDTESAKLYTLANLIASCVNLDGGTPLAGAPVRP